MSAITDFRQYRNPGQDASGKNGTYGHPITTRLEWKINNNTYNIIAEDILYITHPRLDLSGKLIIRGCVHTCLHIYLFILFTFIYIALLTIQIVSKHLTVSN